MGLISFIVVFQTYPTFDKNNKMNIMKQFNSHRKLGDIIQHEPMLATRQNPESNKSTTPFQDLIPMGIHR